MTDRETVIDWLLDSDPAIRSHHHELLVDLGEAEGQPSRWITLRALRVVRWAGRAEKTPAPSTASA